jgi:hypothetical protein
MLGFAGFRPWLSVEMIGIDLKSNWCKSRSQSPVFCPVLAQFLSSLILVISLKVVHSCCSPSSLVFRTLNGLSNGSITKSVAQF